MPRVNNEVKQERKERVLMLIRRHRGLRESEIANLLGFERRTVHNYLTELDQEMKIYKEGVLWLATEDSGKWLLRFPLAADQALALYLATRLFVKQSDKRNETAISALSRLAEVLKTDLPAGADIFHAAQELQKRPSQAQYESHFTTVAKAFLLRHPISLTYEPLNGQAFTTKFNIYLIEPSAIGYTLYLIGHSAHVDALRSYKIERIQAAKIHYDETYLIPDDFPGLDILNNAWSIIMGPETMRIVLRFSERVKSRVLETNWHPSQGHEEEADGSLRWWVEVADTLDMLPWIRGWGADVEVLEPEGLRKKLARTAQALAQIYDVTVTQKLLHHLPYAKTNRENKDEIHLLLYHLIDVGQVATVLWKNVLPLGVHQHLAALFKLTIDEMGRLLAFLVSLHDIGKAGPAYQNKYAPTWLKKELIQAGLILQDTRYSYQTQNEKTPHATVSMWFLKNYLPQALQIEPRLANRIATALGGHHGAWPGPGTDRGIDDSIYPNWDTLRQDLVWELKAYFNPPVGFTTPQRSELNQFLTWFSGFASVADWLGSRNKECFGFTERPFSTRQYALQSAQKAQSSLSDLGWMGWQPKGTIQSFAQTFSYLNFTEPRPVQQQVIEAAINCASPTLLILEAPTGLGKTETALYVADHWLQKHAGSGLYIAMPTQATSNQMFGRLKAYLRHRYPHDLVNTHLVHGQANWLDQLKEIELQTIGDDEMITGVAAMSWFKPRKRTLLAPFGVGTVDQALLSILQTKHFFVRLFALSHKVVIFDEVHAYDTYMSALFHHLLTWLRQMGTSVIILSATLPSKTKQDLVEAYTGPTEWSLATEAYPAVTLAEPNQSPRFLPLTAPPKYTLEIDSETVSRDPSAVVAYLQTTLAQGGCAAVICNTVGRAQALYRVLQNENASLGVAQDDLILFHARFPPIWRTQIEETVLDKFGKDKPEKRPHRAIVVATQVIEQSLDLDFDVMITDLAPIDLILQRAGRLHRHNRGPRQHERKLIITTPEHNQANEPQFGPDGYVYEPYILLQSMTALQRSHIIIPDDTITLIETVYGEYPQDKQPYPDVYACMQKNQQEATRKAGSQLILEPTNQRLMAHSIRDLEEDNPEIHRSFRAQTRDIAPSITIVCLHEDEKSLFVYEGEKRHPVDLENEPSYKLTRLLLQNSINLHRHDLVNALLAQDPPQGWKRSVSLRHGRAIIFHHGRASIPSTNLILKLSRDFGLEITKEEAK